MGEGGGCGLSPYCEATLRQATPTSAHERAQQPSPPRRQPEGKKKNFFCCTFNLKQTLELHRHVCVRVCPPHFISPLASHNLTTTAPHRKWLRSGSAPTPNQQDQISVSLSVSAGVRWCRLINSSVAFQRSVPSTPTTPDST